MDICVESKPSGEPAQPTLREGQQLESLQAAIER
jgi:hypothetical protein